jgi:hypothetical protein
MRRYAVLFLERGEHRREKAQRNRRRGWTPPQDASDTGGSRLREVEATRYARQRTGRRLEHNLAPANNESTQKERVTRRK